MAHSGRVSTISNFDMVRLTKAKRAVDLSPNTIRAYSRQGLGLYRMGRAVFFSRAELDAFIRAQGQVGAVRMRGPVVG
jgi:hypothetical protein